MNQFIGTANEPNEAAVVIALCLAPSLRICYSGKCGGYLCREHCAKRLRYALARHWWLWVAFVAETSRGAIYWKMGVRLCTRHYDWNMNQGFKVDSSHVLRGTWCMAQLCSVSVDVVQVIKVMNEACSMNTFQSLGNALTDRLVSAPVWWCWNMAKICHSWRMSWCATLLCRSFPSLSWYCSFGSFVYCMCFSLFFAWVLSLSAWKPPGFTACAFRNCSSFLAFRVAVSTACCSWAWLGVAWHKFSL